MTNNVLGAYPFSSISFLKDYIFVQNALPFSDKELTLFDKDLSFYEKVSLSPEIEKALISKNELLTSFAISKAEISTLSLTEAKNVYDLIVNNPDYDFIAQKLTTKKKLTQKDYEKLEYFNILKTFRELNSSEFSLKKFSPDTLLELHKSLTQGMDIFQEHIQDFTPYYSGKWRKKDDIRVGTFAPSPAAEIPQSMETLTEWIKKNQTPVGISLFHTALYAVHPFNNGNKRICRILEHLLFRQIGMNKGNLYSTSYYYHKEKDRYYKYLLASLERKNLNHFTAFIQEALTLSIISIIKTNIEFQRQTFLSKADSNTRRILNPLIKKQTMQFNDLYKRAKRKMARQTFVNYLQNAVGQGWATRTPKGKKVFYSLNFFEVEGLAEYREKIDFTKTRLDYIPEEFKTL